MRYIYRQDANGQIKAVPILGGLIRTDWANRPWYEQTMRGYYDLECAGNFRRKDMSKTFIRDTWKERAERGG